MNNLNDIFKRFNDKLCLYPLIGGFYSTFNASTQSGPNQVRPCSLIKSPADNPGVFDIKNNNILPAVNSDYWRNLRRRFLNGEFEQIEECRTCIDAEKHCGSSTRIGGSQHFVDHSNMDIIKEIEDIIANDYYVYRLAGLYYFPSNYCNYACVMCNGGASTSRLAYEIKYSGQNRQVFINPVDEDFYKLLHGVDFVNFTGGETLLQPEVYNLIDYLVDNNLSSKMTIMLLTNASASPKKLMEQFKQFKRVLVIVSVDGINDVIEYQRRGSCWDDVDANAKKYLTHEKIEPVFNYVMSPINALSFMDFADWAFDNQVEFIALSHVHGVKQLNIKCLPPDLKELAVERLKNGLAKYSSGTSKPHRDIVKLINQAIEMLISSPYEEELLSKFISHIRKEDSVSKKSLVDVVPEWAPYFK